MNHRMQRALRVARQGGGEVHGADAAGPPAIQVDPLQDNEVMRGASPAAAMTSTAVPFDPGEQPWWERGVNRAVDWWKSKPKVEPFSTPNIPKVPGQEAARTLLTDPQKAAEAVWSQVPEPLQEAGSRVGEALRTRQMPAAEDWPQIAAGTALGVRQLAQPGARAAEQGMKVAGRQGLDMFRAITGRDFGSALTDLELLPGRGDMHLPPGVTPRNFQDHVNRMIADVKGFNTPDRRYWYERSGRDAILSAVGGDPEMADRLTANIARTSQSTDVLHNAAHSATAHHQIMAGEPVHAGMFPEQMSPSIEGYYHEPQPNVVGAKITGYQSGFRTGWVPTWLNRGANDRHNMRWLGWTDYGLGDKATSTPTVAQHNYDRMVRSAVTDRLNAEGFDGGNWMPGQVQAVGWAKQRALSGIPEDQAGYDLRDAFRDRAVQLTYESAPGKTAANHMPEFHNAPWEHRLEFHDAINKVLQDEHGRDLIAAHMGLLTHPTRPGLGVYQGATNPGSAAQAIAGTAGGWRGGMDPATRELLDASEITRGLLLRQDAVAAHFPAFPKELTENFSPVTKRLKSLDAANLSDVSTGVPMTEAEGRAIGQHMTRETGSDFFSPIYRENGWRLLNNPDVSGVSNHDFHSAIDRTLRSMYPEDKPIGVHRGYSDTMYHDEDWSKTNGQNYLQRLRAQRPDIQRRVSEVLATLGPRISQVENAFAKKHGWTPDPATRVWERNPAYQQHAAELAQVPIGKPPTPWAPQQRSFFPELLNHLGGEVYQRGGRVGPKAEIYRRLSDPRVKRILDAPHRIDRTHTIPYVAGISNDMHTLYQDRRLPADKNHDELLWLHECGEAALMKFFGDEYTTAHRLITIAEKEEAKRRGVDWDRYESYFRSWSKRLEHAPHPRIPKDLFRAPYTESGAEALLRS